MTTKPRAALLRVGLVVSLALSACDDTQPAAACGPMCDVSCRDEGHLSGICTSSGCECRDTVRDGGLRDTLPPADAGRADTTDSAADDVGVRSDGNPVSDASADASHDGCSDADGVQELCGDMIDNDGDGAIDEDCDCVQAPDEEPLVRLYCGGTPEAGGCYQSCVDEWGDLDGDGEFDDVIRSYWGRCRGPAGATESCDGIDNDCDGQIDEGKGCGGSPAAENCIQTCEGCALGECRPAMGYDGLEVCDDIDNDCDGDIDEGCPCEAFFVRTCANPDDDCKQMCTLSEGDEAGWFWGGCTPLVPSPELCGDQTDNNCNGLVDENCGCDGS